MRNDDSVLKVILLAIVLLLAVFVLRLLFDRSSTVSAQSGRFDDVMIASSGFLDNGQQGMLAGQAHGNVWFPKQNESFPDPVFVMRLQFENIDQAPRSGNAVSS